MCVTYGWQYVSEVSGMTHNVPSKPKRMNNFLRFQQLVLLIANARLVAEGVYVPSRSTVVKGNNATPFA
jgi:hypothetical protein